MTNPANKKVLEQDVLKPSGGCSHKGNIYLEIPPWKKPPKTPSREHAMFFIINRVSFWEAGLQCPHVKSKRNLINVRNKGNGLARQTEDGVVLYAAHVTLWPALCYLKWFSWFCMDINSEERWRSILWGHMTRTQHTPTGVYFLTAACLTHQTSKTTSKTKTPSQDWTKCIHFVLRTVCYEQTYANGYFGSQHIGATRAC